MKYQSTFYNIYLATFYIIFPNYESYYYCQIFLLNNHVLRLFRNEKVKILKLSKINQFFVSELNNSSKPLFIYQQPLPTILQ